jgi:hypothetical protein
MLRNNLVSGLVLIFVILTLWGCDAGNSAGVSSGSSTTISGSSTTVSGSVVAGPASGTSVTVSTVSGVVVAGPVTTAADGTYSVLIPSAALSSDLIFVASGGSFPDEATSASGVALGTLTAHVSAGTLTAGSNVSLDPSSTIIQRLITGGKTRAQAESDFAAAFGYNPDTTVKPAFATISTASSTPQRLLGFRAAVFSRLTQDLGLSAAQQFDLIKALAEDLTDGKLDGKKGSTLLTATSLAAMGIPGIASYSDDISNRYVTALLNFQSSAINKSKLKTSQINAPPFGKVSYTTNYRVEYISPTDGEFVSRDNFQLKITKLSDGSPASGLASSIVLKPDMVMGSVMGTIWPNATVETGTSGIYTGRVYYSMETKGLDMYWKLNVQIGAETAVFYPNISAFNMMDTVSVKYSNGTDLTTGSTKRSYRIWRDGLTAGAAGTYDFTVFVSSTDAVNTLPVFAGQSWTTAALTLSTVVLQGSIDGTNWFTLTSAGSTGRFSASGLSMTKGVTGKVYVKLSINGNIYTSNGLAFDGGTTQTSNAVQVFNVTPN